MVPADSRVVTFVYDRSVGARWCEKVVWEFFRMTTWTLAYLFQVELFCCVRSLETQWVMAVWLARARVAQMTLQHLPVIHIRVLELALYMNVKSGVREYGIASIGNSFWKGRICSAAYTFPEFTSKSMRHCKCGVGIDDQDNRIYVDNPKQICCLRLDVAI